MPEYHLKKATDFVRRTIGTGRVLGLLSQRCLGGWWMMDGRAAVFGHDYTRHHGVELVARASRALSWLQTRIDVVMTATSQLFIVRATGVEEVA